MSFGSILLGALIGGVISSGAVIGITFLGTLVPWWALLLIAGGGTLIGGFVAGLIAKGAGAGALAGIISGVIVMVGLFLFSWLYYKNQLIALAGSFADVSDLVDAFLLKFGLAGTQFGQVVHDWIIANAPTTADIVDFANAKFIYFALIFTAIIGGLAAVLNFFAGMIGGAFTRKKKDQQSYDNYY
ncbi:MAG: hypothetical protein JXA54_16015 [Candidatus Heimdallarchaeota archaeon]|nr:hypothetical protein [Candidatus Heimdallarchaeota archaeon]